MMPSVFTLALGHILPATITTRRAKGSVPAEKVLSVIQPLLNNTKSNLPRPYHEKTHSHLSSLIYARLLAARRLCGGRHKVMATSASASVSRSPGDWLRNGRPGNRSSRRWHGARGCSREAGNPRKRSGHPRHKTPSTRGPDAATTEGNRCVRLAGHVR